MRIKELSLLGFKSFPNKTTLKFSPGITAIIGPNGCGKTNILDALRWVLGEESRQTLRCNRNEELIFSGTEKVSPVGFAEVKLVLANENELPNFSSEIEIKRRYFRSGESEYYLNRQPCRLKDIQEIFLNSKLGTKAYSIFDLRQIREIISGELRGLFEEAANLKKFQESKSETERKLALTDQEFLRLDDIIRERERVTRSLKRQARQYQKFEALNNEARQLNLWKLKKEYERISANAKIVCEELKKDEADEVKLLELNKNYETELEEKRNRLKLRRAENLENQKKIEEIKDELKDLAAKNLLKNERLRTITENLSELEKTEKDLKERLPLACSAKELKAQALEKISEELKIKEAEFNQFRAETKIKEDRLFQKEQELETIKSHARTELTKNLKVKAEKEARIENLKTKELQLLNERKEFQVKINDLKIRLDNKNQESSLLKKRLADAEIALENEKQKLSKVKDNLKELTENLKAQEATKSQFTYELELHQNFSKTRELILKELGDDCLGLTNNLLQIEPGMEKAVACALYHLLDFFVIKNQNPDFQDILKRITEIAQKNPITVGLIFDDRENGPEPVVIEPDLLKEERVIGKLTDFVKFQPDAPKLLAYLLSQFIVVSDLNTGLELLKKHSSNLSYVTKEGAAVFNNRVLVFRAFAAQERIKEIKLNQATVNQEITNLNLKISDLKKACEELEIAIANQNKEIFNLSLEKTRIDGEIESINNTILETNKTIEKLTTELETTQKQVFEFEAVGLPLESAPSFETGIEQLETLVKEEQKEITARLENAQEMLREITRIRETYSNLNTELRLIEKELADSKQRLTEISERKSILAKEQALLQELKIEDEVEIKKKILAETAKADDDSIKKLEADIEELEKMLATNRNELDICRKNLFEKRLKKAKTETELNRIATEVRNCYNLNIADDLSPIIGEEEVTEDAIAERLKIINQELVNLGRTNPLALEEYTREKAELEKYQRERADIIQAKENLKRLIQEIQNYARQEFLNTYNAVRQNFQKIFARLFVEGEADLILADENNPLESEISIIAKPFGKSPKRLEHLSDGEKALLALSLLFAFYSVKPAPFCFLDEVDAPLDDANVGRFADYLNEISVNTQVVIITHNRLTIERVAVIFGVTSEEPGISKIVSLRLADYKPEPVARF